MIRYPLTLHLSFAGQHSFLTALSSFTFLSLFFLLPACTPNKTLAINSLKSAVAISPAQYFYVDPQQILPSDIREKALAFYNENQNEVFDSRDFNVVILRADTPEKIKYQIDMQTGEVLLQNENLQNSPDEDRLVYTAVSRLEENSQSSKRNWSVPNQAEPLWEAKHPQSGGRWTEWTVQTLQADGSHLLAGSKDMSDFCPAYGSISTEQKLKFWTFLISAVAQYESGLEPTLRYRESSMGRDPVTGQHVYSEGLLQLSYQDRQAYPFCNEFDWQMDRSLTVTSPQRTIFDPHKNLRCGIRILDQIVGRNGRISFSGHYWATLKPHNSAKRAIQALTNQISFCQK